MCLSISMGDPLDMCERINEILEKCAKSILYVYIERI